MPFAYWIVLLGLCFAFDGCLYLLLLQFMWFSGFVSTRC